MEINSRIALLIEKLGDNKSSFATKVGVSQPIITHITNGRNNPGLEVIQKILTTCPEVNPEWLILGSGEMFVNNLLQKKILNNLLAEIRENLVDLEAKAVDLKSKIEILENLVR
jgi:transcriptional regulator with XRE-family HTH domain